MEEMLQNFTNSGIADIAFMVVNSKKERSQELLPILEGTVSFPVYQETSDEEVWSVLGGGKDDMFVYDRCGRLVAYVPYPLSMLDNDRSLIYNFILYAYHRDPCAGISPCSEIENDLLLEDPGNENDTMYSLHSTDDGYYAQENLTSGTNELFLEDDGGGSWLSINETINLRSNNSFHKAGNSSENSSHSETQIQGAFQGISNSIWDAQNLGERNTTNTNFSTLSMPSPSVEENEAICNNTGNCGIIKHFNRTDINNLTMHDIKSKSDNMSQTSPKRICAAEDEKVCEQWSKRQLKHIQKCCTRMSGNFKDEVNQRGEKICRSFHRKRCKKLRTVIKCCLKTHDPGEYDENTGEEQLIWKQNTTDAPKMDFHNHAEHVTGKVS